MRRYGVQAAASTEGDIRGALADAAAEAGRSGRPFSVGAASDGSLAVAEHAWGLGKKAGGAERLSLVACTAGPGGGFHRSGTWGMRGIDGAAAVASDCLARGIMGYGSLGFLSEGRIQLRGAIADARHTIRHLGGWYILGMARGDAGLMLAPASMAGRFVAPRSLYVGPLGAWTVSRIHSCRFPMRARFGAGARPRARPGRGQRPAAGAPGAPRKGGAVGRPAVPAQGGSGGAAGQALPNLGIMHRLYIANGYGTVEHGRLESDAGVRLLQLENAIEDAATLGAYVCGRYAVRLDCGGMIKVIEVPIGHAPAGAESGSVIDAPYDGLLVVVDPEELRHGGPDAEFAGAVRNAARRAHGAYCARRGCGQGGRGTPDGRGRPAGEAAHADYAREG